MTGSIILRTVVATFMTLGLIAASVDSRIEPFDLAGAAMAGILWWTLLTDWTESRRNGR